MKIIKLTQGQETIVDDDDYEWLIRYKWNAVKAANGLFYARRYHYVLGERVLWSMSRKIMKVTDPLILVDHKNRDTLDNRKINLRLSNKSLNAINSDRVDNASGIYYDRRRCRYKVFLLQPRRYIGTYKTEAEALEARWKAKEKGL